MVGKFSIVEFEIRDLELITVTKIADNLEERANTIVVWNRPPTQHNDVGKCWVAAVFVEVGERFPIRGNLRSGTIQDLNLSSLTCNYT